ncbi:hypothetical protein ACA910_003981 [Epithemia clementina (nom. ined.)]
MTVIAPSTHSLSSSVASTASSSSSSATTTTTALEPLGSLSTQQQQQQQQQPSSLPQHHPLPSTSTLSSSLSSLYSKHCYYLLPMLGWFLFSTSLSSYNKIVFGHNNAVDEVPLIAFSNITAASEAGGDALFNQTNPTEDLNDATLATTTTPNNGHLGFPCPLLLTSIHFLAQWIFSETLCALWPRYWGSTRISSMTWTEYWTISVPCGLVTSADIGLSNLSYATLSLTFYTLIKSSTPIFVLFWAQLFGLLERGITGPLILVICLITLGEYVTVAGELKADDFQWTGFVLCLSAAILSGARWTLVQLKIQALQPPLKTTVATMRLLAPSMFVSLFVVSLLLEHPWHRLPLYFVQQQVLQEQQIGQLVPSSSSFDHDNHRMLSATTTTKAAGATSDWNDPTDNKDNKDDNLDTLNDDMVLDADALMVAMVELMGLGLFGAFFAIAMILCEFYLIMKTNAIVLTVGGVIKEIITIWVGVFLFGDSFTWHSFWGCCILFAGVLLYKVVFHQQQQKAKQQQQQQALANSKDHPHQSSLPSAKPRHSPGRSSPFRSSSSDSSHRRNNKHNSSDSDFASLLDHDNYDHPSSSSSSSTSSSLDKNNNKKHDGRDHQDDQGGIELAVQQ